MYKISIIIPVYNASKYLEECLESVLFQTYDNWEVICVDDCSKDDSYQKLLDYQKKDSRFKVFKMKYNSGSGEVRNYALSKASGDYILFMDPDDKYACDYVFEKYIEIIRSKKVDCVCANAGIFDGNKIIHRKKPIFKEDVLGSFKDFVYSGGYWRFLFKKSILDKYDIKFPKYRRRQDPVFFINYISKMDKIYFLSDIFYMYRMDHKKIKWTADVLTESFNSFRDNLNILSKMRINQAIKNEYDLYVFYWVEYLIPFVFKYMDFKTFNMIRDLNSKINIIMKDNNIRNKSILQIILLDFTKHNVKKFIKRLPYLGKMLAKIKNEYL